MSFIIVNTTNQKLDDLLRRWNNGSSGQRQSAMKYFIRKLGPGTYLMKANAAVLALLYHLKVKYGNGIYIFLANSLEVEAEFPKEVIEVVKECQIRKRNLLEKDLEKLEEIQINCSVSWNQNS